MADQGLRDDVAKLIVEALGIGTGKHETSLILEMIGSLDATFPDTGGHFPAELLRNGRPDPDHVARALAAAAPTAAALVNELVRVGGRFMDMVQDVYARLARHAATIEGNKAAEKFRFERGGIDEDRLTISPAFIEQWRRLFEAVHQVELGLIDEDRLYLFLLWDTSTFYGGRYVKAVGFEQLPSWVLAMNRTGAAEPDADQRAAEQVITAAERVVRARIARLRDHDGDAGEDDEDEVEEHQGRIWVDEDNQPAEYIRERPARYRRFLRDDRDFLQETGLVGMYVYPESLAGSDVPARTERHVIGLDASMSPVLKLAGEEVSDQRLHTPVGELAAFIAMWRLGLVPVSDHQPLPARDLPARPVERGEWLSGYRAACDRATRWLTDDVFTPTGTAEVTGLTEKIDEFLNLPLWRHRELLYEIWVLCATLDACEQAEWNTDRLSLSRDGDEWVLPVGRSNVPVAMLRHGRQPAMTLEVWREPERQAGGREFTPDVTVSTGGPYAVDLLVVEAKDRVNMPSGVARDGQGAEQKSERAALAVARRYAEALRPRAVWVCNHCDFRRPASATDNHGTEWTQIRLAGRFRPGHVPGSLRAVGPTCPRAPGWSGHRGNPWSRAHSGARRHGQHALAT